jgi:hypothetical protein
MLLRHAKWESSTESLETEGDDDLSLNSSFTVIHDNVKVPLDYIAHDEDYNDYTITMIKAASSLSSNHEAENTFSSSNLKRRKVQFDESLNKTYESILECHEDCKSLWYSAEDCKAFKAAHSASAREVIDAESHHSNDPYSYRNTLHRTYDACCRVVQETDDCALTLQDVEHLRECMKLYENRIGLERVAIRSVARDRHERYRELVGVVSTIQRMESTVDAETRTEFICSSCESFSRASRLFALYLAQAQASMCSELTCMNPC